MIEKIAGEVMYWPDAHNALIVALRNYIVSDEAVGRELLQEEAITRKKFDEGMKAIEPQREMLRVMEAHDMHPLPFGRVKLKH